MYNIYKSTGVWHNEEELDHRHKSQQAQGSRRRVVYEQLRLLRRMEKEFDRDR